MRNTKTSIRSHTHDSEIYRSPKKPPSNSSSHEPVGTLASTLPSSGDRINPHFRSEAAYAIHCLWLDKEYYDDTQPSK